MYYLGLWGAKFYYRFIEKHPISDRMGMVAHKLDKDFLYHIKKPKTVIAVTGTNGKTTTCNFLADMLENMGYSVACNRESANLRPGIAKALINKTSIFGKPQADFAILEFDEIRTKEYMDFIKPDYIVVTNLTTDNPSHNSHVDWVFNRIKEGIPKDCTLVLNGDDLISCQLAGIAKKTVFFSLKQQPWEANDENPSIRDIKVCPKCYHKLVFEFARYNHIGKAHCPNCDFKNPEPTYLCQKVDPDNNKLLINDEQYPMVINRATDIYNQLAAISVCKEIGLSNIASGIKNLGIVKSRYDSIQIGDMEFVSQLAKGEAPISFNRALDFAVNLKGSKDVIIYINSMAEYNNPRYIENMTYLYDQDFAELNNDDIRKIIIVGPKINDFKVRMMFDDIDMSKVIFLFDENELINHVEKGVDKLVLIHGVDALNFTAKFIEQVKEKLA